MAPVEQLAPEFLSYDLLGPEDQLISEQIRSAESRNCTVAARVLLRVGLSHAMGGRINPRDWRFRTALNGRPVIAKGWPQFNFSISHTDTVAVVAISETLPIGIDVETLEETPTQDLVTTYCSPDEQLLFKAAAPHQCSREFIRLWTLKEAYAKMVGFGHSLDFASIGVALDSLSCHQTERMPKMFSTLISKRCGSATDGHSVTSRSQSAFRKRRLRRPA